MEELTIEEIELIEISLSMWRSGHEVNKNEWDEVELLEEKLERMKTLLLGRRQDS